MQFSGPLDVEVLLVMQFSDESKRQRKTVTLEFSLPHKQQNYLENNLATLISQTSLSQDYLKDRYFIVKPLLNVNQYISTQIFHQHTVSLKPV